MQLLKLNNARKAVFALIFMISVLFVPILTGCRMPGWILQREPQVNQDFPNLALAAPIINGSRFEDYATKAPANLSDLQLDGIIIFFFSMHCRYCADAAAQANIIHAELAKRNLSDRIEIVGVALGNSEHDAKRFAEKYRLQFPVYADADSHSRDQLGRIGVPAFFAVDLRGNRQTAMLSRRGALSENPAAFVSRFLEKGVFR